MMSTLFLSHDEALSLRAAYELRQFPDKLSFGDAENWPVCLQVAWPVPERSNLK